MARRDHLKGSIPYRFIALPIEIIKSVEWQALPASAKGLALDLAVQYTGKNNGRLCPAYEVMRRDAGWTSPAKLIRAKKRLLEAPFAILTRKGHPPRTSEWIGFTWWKLNFEQSMEIDPRRFPYLNFATLSVVPNRYDEAGKTPPGHTESVRRGPLKSAPSVPKRNHAS